MFDQYVLGGPVIPFLGGVWMSRNFNRFVGEQHFPGFFFEQIHEVWRAGGSHLFHPLATINELKSGAKVVTGTYVPGESRLEFLVLDNTPAVEQSPRKLNN